MNRKILGLILCLVFTTGVSGCTGADYKVNETEVTTVFEINLSESSTEAINEGEINEENIDSQITLLFGGDILLSDHVLSAYGQAGGIEGILDQGFLKVIDEADLFIANQEFPFSDRGTAAEDKQFTFRLSPEKVHIFQEMKLDLVSLANNHALDFGRDALMDTIETLDQAGISHIGAGENLEQAKNFVIKEINGIKVGFLGATRVIPVPEWAATQQRGGMLSTYDPSVLLSSISELRSQCDYLVVYVHWGIERAETPESYQRTLGQQYIDAGADLVVGSHPHVLQGIEYYKGKPIIYSLGNFIFGSSIPKTALLQVVLEKGQNDLDLTLKLIPGTARNGHTQKLTDEARQQEFYQYMESISQEISITGQGEVQEHIIKNP